MMNPPKAGTALSGDFRFIDAGFGQIRFKSHRQLAIGRPPVVAVSFFRSAMTHTEPIRLAAAADSRRPLVIAGPCSAETEEQTLATARQQIGRAHV